MSTCENTVVLIDLDNNISVEKVSPASIKNEKVLFFRLYEWVRYVRVGLRASIFHSRTLYSIHKLSEPRVAGLISSFILLCCIFIVLIYLAVSHSVGIFVWRCCAVEMRPQDARYRFLFYYSTQTTWNCALHSSTQ